MSRIPAASERELILDEMRKASPASNAMKTFAGGIGCAAIVAALIYTKRHRPEPDSANISR